MEVESLVYTSSSSSSVKDGELKEIAALFTDHYGNWAAGPRKGRQPHMSSERLKAGYFFDRNCRVVTARTPLGELIGHVLFRSFPLKSGTGVWVSQLVVHARWRNHGLASSMLGLALASTRDLRACGMATCNPYAVRALERAMGQRCSPAAAGLVASELLAACGVPYVQDKPVRIALHPPTSVIDTAFLVDHTATDAARASLSCWQLGSLAEGEEYLAVVLRT